MENKDLMKQENKEVGFFTPGEIGDGFENVESTDLSPNFLRIAQSNHDFTKKGSPTYIEGFDPGNFFDSTNQKNMGNSVKAIVLGFMTNYVEWGEDLGEFKGSYNVTEFKNLQGLTQDERKPTTWSTPEGTKIVETKNYFVFLPDYPELDILLFCLSGPGITQSKKWMTKMSGVLFNGKKAPIYAAVWEIKTQFVSNDEYSWYAIGDRKSNNVQMVGFVPEELQSRVIELRKTVADWISTNKSISYKDSNEEQFSSELDEEI